MIAIVSQTIVFSLLLGFIWLRIGGAKSGSTVQSVAGLLFFALVNQGLSGATFVVFAFPSERAVVLKERASRTYHLSAYFWSKAIIDLPRIVLTNFLFSVITYFMAGLRDGGEYFFAFFAVMCLAQMAAESIAYAVSAAAKDVQMASTLFSVFMYVLAGKAMGTSFAYCDDCDISLLD